MDARFWSLEPFSPIFKMYQSGDRNRKNILDIFSKSNCQHNQSKFKLAHFFKLNNQYLYTEASSSFASEIKVLHSTTVNSGLRIKLLEYSVR